MSDQNERPQENVKRVFVISTDDDRGEMIDQINTDQYRDELDRKVKVYNDVKATLDLCRTMIRALDTTSIDEAFNKKMLVQHLELSQTEALLSVLDVEQEIRGLGK